MKKMLIALFALAVVAPVLAQDAQGPPPAVEAAHNQVVRFLQLTEDQVLAWDEIYLIHRDAEQLLFEDIALVQADIEDLLAEPDPDPAALGELVLVRRDLGEQVADVHRMYHEDFLALLDEDQAGRLEFINRADDVQRIIPAFKHFELIPRR
jgi:hypothetical protein